MRYIIIQHLLMNTFSFSNGSPQMRASCAIFSSIVWDETLLGEVLRNPIPVGSYASYGNYQSISAKGFRRVSQLNFATILTVSRGLRVIEL